MKSMLNNRKAWVGAASALTIMGSIAIVAPLDSASAAGRDGHCNTGEFCYYYNSNQKGSVSDFTTSIPNLGSNPATCYVFKGKGAGRGKCVKNDAASVRNRTDKTVRVYYNENYSGSYQDIKPGQRVNLSKRLKNDNASHRIGGKTPPSGGCRTEGSNSRRPTTILVWRKQKGVVERVPFKTYVRNVLPQEWITSWNAASLEAGAMAVKNFGWYWALHSNRKTPGGQCYDVTDDTSSQVYRPGSATARTNAAVERTWNKRITRGGKVMQTHYCSTTTACPAWRSGDWMSQYGSQDLAKRGWGYASILHKYYRNIAIK